MTRSWSIRGTLRWPSVLRPQSVRAKFLLINVPLVVAASLLAFTVFEYYNYRQQMAELAQKKTRLLQSQVEILAPALRAGQRPRVQHVLAVLVTDPDVVGAKVRDDSGRLFGAVGITPEKPGGRAAMVGTQPIKYFTDASYHRIGELRIAMTDRRALMHLYRSTLLAAAMTGALVLAAIASAMIAHWRTIGIPLTRLQRAIDSGRSQGGEVRPKVAWQSDDEIGAVVRAYNDLQDVQTRHEAKLRAAWDEAETAKVRAQAATRAKSAFLANMSHEIRTPMNAVLGFADLLRKQELTAQQREYVHMIHASGSNLLGILNDILDFSKIEAGRMELAEAPFEVETLLSHVAAVTALGAEDKGLDLFLRAAPEVPTRLYGDVSRLEQMLVNLVNNAVKFTETGHVRVDLDRVADARGRWCLRLAVTDTGIGMDAEAQAGLFQPFAQADGSTTRRHGGTGLGLAIVGKLTDLMAGTIDVDSAPGAGTTFAITVPLQPAAGEPPGPQPDLAGTRILIAEDHPAGAAILAECLRGRNARVETADTAAKTREALARGHWDLVLLDWDIAGPDQATAREPLLVRLGAGHAGDSYPPAIIMAGTRAREAAMARAAEYGITRALTKPVLATPLLNAAERVMATGPAIQDTEPPPAQAPEPDENALADARILLAEDNDINQEVAREILESAGAEVLLAETGEAAVAALENPAGRPPDVVLMDVQMPELDGYAATERIRAREAQTERPRRPIIAMTAHAMAQEREKCLQAGMDDHIAKPMDPEHLVRTVAAWLPHADQQPQRAAQAS
jgi:signal transduction histidine kinase/DNA-binding response OmpR family regulator